MPCFAGSARRCTDEMCERTSPVSRTHPPHHGPRHRPLRKPPPRPQPSFPLSRGATVIPMPMPVSARGAARISRVRPRAAPAPSRLAQYRLAPHPSAQSRRPGLRAAHRRQRRQGRDQALPVRRLLHPSARELRAYSGLQRLALRRLYRRRDGVPDTRTLQ